MPKDPIILLSYVNTKLRDEFASPQELCDSLGEDLPVLEEKLAAVGFQYDAASNQYR